MKKTLLAFLLSIIISKAENLLLTWEFPVSEVSTDLTYRVYAAPKVGSSYTNIAIISAQTTNDSNYFKFTWPREQLYIIMSASNKWGESFFSEMDYMPSPIASVTNNKVRLGIAPR